MSNKRTNSRVKRKPSHNNHNLSRTILSDVKLEVRKRCGFGCVVCGLGIYEYEHFSPEFKNATSHDPNGITLLCPNHHAKKTKGILSLETIKKFNANPKALRRGFVKEDFDLYSTDLTVVLGTTTFKKTPVILQIDDEPILSIVPGDEDEPYSLSANLRDSSGNIIMEIDKNEWKTSTEHWDCKTIGDRIQIRKAVGKIELIIRQIPPHELRVERLTMIHRGYKIELHESDFTKFTTPEGFGFQSKDFLLENWEIGVLLQYRDGLHTQSVGYIAREGGGIMGLGIVQALDRNGELTSNS
jgi:hypothetical protein